MTLNLLELKLLVWEMNIGFCLILMLSFCNFQLKEKNKMETKKKTPQAYKRTRENALGTFSHLMEE